LFCKPPNYLNTKTCQCLPCKIKNCLLPPYHLNSTTCQC
jgi:hypothetical protein